jgi:hypothetical protein
MRRVRLSDERVAQLEAVSYIGKIRNKEKRAYAWDIYKNIIQGDKWIFAREYVLGYMAKQAVQIRLNEILRGGSQ